MVQQKPLKLKIEQKNSESKGSIATFTRSPHLQQVRAVVELSTPFASHNVVVAFRCEHRQRLPRIENARRLVGVHQVENFLKFREVIDAFNVSIVKPSHVTNQVDEPMFRAIVLWHISRGYSKELFFSTISLLLS